MTQERGKRKVRTGVVVSDKMDKTVLVRVERLYEHPVYKKYVRQRRNYMAHDEENACRIGDLVQIIETRPLSRNKCWRIQTVLQKAPEER